MAQKGDRARFLRIIPLQEVLPLPPPPLTRVTRLAKDPWAQFSSGSSAHVASLMLDKLLKNV